MVCLGDTDPVDGVDIICKPTEHEVINAWFRLLRQHKTDVLVGYNTHQFDWRYVAGRCTVLVDDDTGEPLVDPELLGRLAEGGGEVRETELNSGAFGQNKFLVMETPGVQQVDVLQYLRRETRLPSYRCAAYKLGGILFHTIMISATVPPLFVCLNAYSLDNVSKHFLGSQKLDLPAAEIFRKFLGTSADRADIARYAVRDTELPLSLLAKLNVIENLTEMANAVSVPMEYLLSRGQQIKVFSVILGKARQLGYLMPDNKAIGLPDGTKYEGATVLDAKRGAYFDVVSGMDFASLVRPWGRGGG